MAAGIIGHEDIIRHLEAVVASGRVSHAYLITGEAGSGKRTIADYFAKLMLCERLNPPGGRDFGSRAPESGNNLQRCAPESGDNPQRRAPESGDNPQRHTPESGDVSRFRAPEPCGACPACKKAAERSHPDILYVTHEKPNLISVDEIRSQVVNTVDILPYDGGRKVYIIADAEKMNPAAQNALLKTIEEPPSYAVILLLSAGPDSLLPTILSRCVRLDLMPLPDRLVERYVREELQMPDYEAKVIAAFAQGNIGRARRAATDETFSTRRERTLSLIKGLSGMNTAAISEAARLLKEDRGGIDEILDIILLYFRDVLYFKASADIDHLIFSNEISAIRQAASASSYEGLTEIVDAADRCRIRLRANVNFELAMELLLLTIKENCNA